DESGCVVFRSGPGQEQGRKTAADFDDQPWLKLPNHAVSDQGVRGAKECVANIKAVAFTNRFDRNLLIFIPEFWKPVSEQIQLHRIVHIDSHEVTWPIPQCPG